MAAIQKRYKQLTTALAGGDVRFWAQGSSMVLYELETRLADINSTVFSPDGRFLLLSSQDGSARLWDVAANQELMRFQANEEPVHIAQNLR